MSIRRSFSKSHNRTAHVSDGTTQKMRFRHRFDRDDVIDMTVAPPPEATPRPLDRAARRASKAALVGYGLCLVAVSAPRRPTVWNAV